jgi:hypothetical protein
LCEEQEEMDSSRALLEAVAVAGLVGIVRQLGDLAGYVSLSLSLSLPNIVLLPFSFCVFAENKKQ